MRPGERVGVAPGWRMWLTPEGKHWSGPDGYENFRSVVDGNIDPTQPGVSLQTDGTGSGILHTGLYYGTRDVGRVELTYGGTTTVRAALVELPGRPGWGAWHVATPVYDQSGTPGVALYDRAGEAAGRAAGTGLLTGRTRPVAGPGDGRVPPPVPHTTRMPTVPYESRSEDDGFAEFAAAAWPRLVRTAQLLTGDFHEAEDLVQTTLAKLYGRWGRCRGGPRLATCAARSSTTTSAGSAADGSCTC